MSVNIYLSDSIESAQGFEKKGNGSDQKFSFNGIKIFHEKGRFYSILHELSESVHPSLLKYVEEITFFELVLIRLIPKRTIGVYQYEDARAELDFRNDSQYELKIRGKNIDAMRKLYLLIRAGKITPCQSWEKKQKMRRPLRSIFFEIYPDDAATGSWFSIVGTLCLGLLLSGVFGWVFKALFHENGNVVPGLIFSGCMLFLGVFIFAGAFVEGLKKYSYNRRIKKAKLAK